MQLLIGIMTIKKNKVKPYNEENCEQNNNKITETITMKNGVNIKST
jgi:hypothetical protein